ncbi:MAG: hypothetical protein AAB527_01285 [Patescibacteria group bacterium]
MNFYLSYLMGAGKITNEELKNLGVEVVNKNTEGHYELKIPE